MNTYKIATMNLETLEKKLNTVSNKCKKNNIPFTFTVSDPFFEEVKNFGAVQFVNVTVDGTVKQNGYEVIAIMEHTEKGNLITPIDDNEIPEKYRYTDAVCEHCNSNRFRKYLYLVKNVDTNEIKQVGKSCLKEYTNGISAEMITLYIECSQFAEETEKDESYMSFDRAPSHYKFENLLVKSILINQAIGFTNAENGGTNKTMLFDICRICDDCLIDTVNYEAPADLTDKDLDNAKETAKAIIEYFTNVDNNSEYYFTIKTLINVKYASKRQFGLIASIPYCYNKAMAKLKEQEKEEATDGFGYFEEVGTKINLNCNVTLKAQFETMYGTTFVYTITDTNNRNFVWKTQRFFENGRYLVKGTVKSHEEYRNVEQTNLTRCKLTASAIA